MTYGSYEETCSQLDALDVSPDSVTGRMLAHLNDRMAYSAQNIRATGDMISGRVGRVDMKLLSAPLEAHLNELGELQDMATAYDGAVAAYAALREQRDRLVQLLEDELEKGRQ